MDGGCHDNRADAVRHMRALYSNVEDVGEDSAREDARQNGKGEKAVTAELQRADIYVPIVKVDKTPEGHRIVTGVAASERLDLDGQRADYEKQNTEKLPPSGSPRSAAVSWPAVRPAICNFRSR